MNALEEVSTGGKSYFTKSQFSYAVDRQLRHIHWLRAWRIPGDRLVYSLGISGVLLLMMMGFGLFQILGDLSWFGPLFLLILALALAESFVSSRLQPVYSGPSVSHRDLYRYISRWESVHGTIPCLLRDRQAAVIPTEKEPDLADYMFTRVLVSDSAEMAHMLIANSFHIINNCAVMSVDGYPPGTFKTLLEMLRRKPEQLDVYALHDASVAGCMLPLTLRGEEWFPDPATRITDLGLRPRQVGAKRFPGANRSLPSQWRNLVQWRGGRLANAVVRTGAHEVVPEELQSILEPEEVAWLERGKRVELPFMPPERLMNAIGHAFRRKDAELTDEAADPLGLMIVVGGAAAIDFDYDSDFG